MHQRISLTCKILIGTTRSQDQHVPKIREKIYNTTEVQVEKTRQGVQTSPKHLSNKQNNTPKKTAEQTHHYKQLTGEFNSLKNTDQKP